MRPKQAITAALFTPLLWAATVPDATAEGNAYLTRVLAVNRVEYATPDTQLVDPLLVNPWGSAIRTAGLGGHFWLANAGQARDADGNPLFDQTGNPIYTVTEYLEDVFDPETGVFLPLSQDALKFVRVDGPPIGQVFSVSSSDFPVTGDLCTDDSLPVCDPKSAAAKYLGVFTGPSRFIVATEDGKIAGWSEGTGNGVFGRMRKFHTVVDNSGHGALYRGLAVTDFPAGNS